MGSIGRGDVVSQCYLPVLENQMEKKIENELATRFL